MTNPIFNYSHAGNDAAIIAGFVYSGTQFPAEYQGSFFYGDYSQRWIRRLTFDPAGNVTGQYAFEPADGALYGPYGDIVELKQGPDSALYYVDIALDMSATPRGPGSVRRISYSANNHPPLIESVSAYPVTGPGPVLPVAFTASASDLDSDPLTYEWNFGDGLTATLATVTHTYATYGAYVARLMVSDGQAQILSDPIDILVGIPPVVTLTAPLSGTLFRAGEVISYSGSASDDATPLTPADYTWAILFRHEGHVHPAAGPITGTAGTYAIPLDGHDFSGETAYEFILTVTDGDGLSSKVSSIIFPDKVTVTLQTEPPGLALNFDELTDMATPFAADTLIGFQHTIGAPITQTTAGMTYTFVSWSDGGAATHTITVPTSDQTYVARYVPSLCGASHCVYLPLVTRHK
jgi:PKD repeat protein